MYVKVYLPDEAAKRFRKAAMTAYGYRKGALSKAAEQALAAWSKNVFPSENLAIPEDPVGAIRGLLRHVKEDSVTLQHHAWKTVIAGAKTR
ncbi:MAG: hypothetical protein AB1626_01890 [Candidatus Micrarchaeota archaeon]